MIMFALLPLDNAQPELDSMEPFKNISVVVGTFVAAATFLFGILSAVAHFGSLEEKVQAQQRFTEEQPKVMEKINGTLGEIRQEIGEIHGEVKQISKDMRRRP